MLSSEVLVVGGGPVGVLNALGLARAGVDVRLVEAEPAVVQSPRAIVYHWSVLEGLERLGILDEVFRSGLTKQDYQWFVPSTGERIELTLGVLEGRVRHPFNIHLGQHRLAEIGLARLAELGVPVHFGTRVTGVSQNEDGVVVTAETADGPARFTAGWGIGADGARSAVRGAVGLAFDGMTWDERFVATDVRCDFEAFGYARATMQVDPRHGAVVVKIDDTGLWRCTYAEDLALPEQGIPERMRDWFAAVLPAQTSYEVQRFSPYRMHQRAASSFRAGRVLLAGDAAHATNPTGGLGLTSGLFDSYVLSEAMAAVVQGRAGEQVLDRYAEERRTTFLEKASPAASENKRFVYHSADPARLEEDLQRFRRMATDPELQVQNFLGTKRLETPSVVGGAG